MQLITQLQIPLRELMSTFTNLDAIKPSYLSDKVQSIIQEIISVSCPGIADSHNGLRLAALFDLFVSCQYYNSIANKGWTYCPCNHQALIYAYTNICPRCVGRRSFVYTKANKPESGQIGVATAEILCAMLASYFSIRGHNIEINRAAEPVDVVIHEPATGTTILAEVKASPLLTIPLIAPCDELTETIDGELVAVGHNLCDNPFLRKSQPALFFPATAATKETTFQLTIDWDAPQPFFLAVGGLCRSNPAFLDFYFSFWEEAYTAYRNKEKANSVFWLTNACGTPSPCPNDWPKRSSGGYESVSDAKTSVGMDRTDDIKKGIYQVLKLGAQYKPGHPNVKTALISNIHAVRHNDEYLQCIKDIIWTIDESRKASNCSQLDPATPLYNLFDGIISFTETDIRDKDVKRLFNF